MRRAGGYNEYSNTGHYSSYEYGGTNGFGGYQQQHASRLRRGSAGGSSTPNNGSNPHHEAQRAIQRTNQVKEDEAHDELLDQKLKDLLSDKLETLRSHIPIMQADNWKYESRRKPADFNPAISRQW